MASFGTYNPYYGGYQDLTAFDPLEYLRRRGLLNQPETPEVPAIPETPSSSDGDSFPPTGSTGDSSGSSMYQNTQDYLKMREDYPEYGIGTLLFPGAGLLDAAGQTVMGINPLGDATGVGNQTFDWYEGSTTYRGDAVSDRNLNRDAYSAMMTARQQERDLGFEPEPLAQSWQSYKNSYGVLGAGVPADVPGPTVIDKSTYANGWGGKGTAQTVANIAAANAAAQTQQQLNQQQQQLQAAQAAAAQAQADALAAQSSVNYGGSSYVGGSGAGSVAGLGGTININDELAYTDPNTGETMYAGGPSDVSGGGSISTDGQGGATYSSPSTGDVSGTDYGGGSFGFDSGYSGGYDGGGDVNGGEIGYEDPGGDSGGDGGGDSGGGGSYIATATTQALGEDGLKVFEDWRDYMFTALPTFTASFGRYRVTAPKIVEQIDNKENSKEIYKDIWESYLKPIFSLIKKDKDSKKALKDYKIMVRELSNKYLK